jgi:hypothetical protein
VLADGGFVNDSEGSIGVGLYAVPRIHDKTNVHRLNGSGQRDRVKIFARLVQKTHFKVK